MVGGQPGARVEQAEQALRAWSWPDGAELDVAGGAAAGFRARADVADVIGDMQMTWARSRRTSPSTRPGSTTWKHSPSSQMSHQKRHSLSEGRVRDTNT